LCFTWSPNLASLSRVTSVVYAGAAGDCTADPVDLSASAEYLIVQNDFTATGGDGYPNVASRMTTQDILEELLADYVTANSPVNPVVKAAPNGRINCVDSNGIGTLPDCPILTPSP
jgi:2',3'-cyclic-nucleotide 2'-phosphodiesterase (5'-nucleotidase family)